MDNDKGGSAFPDFKHDGMTLRDYFAAKALSGFIASRRSSHSGEDGAETLAIDAYMVADAMLAERVKP